MEYEKARALTREEVIEVIDELIVPAQKEGRVVFTNGARWEILEDKGKYVHEIDITAPAGLEKDWFLTPEKYAELWGLTLPLQTLPAEPNATNWLVQ